MVIQLFKVNLSINTYVVGENWKINVTSSCESRLDLSIIYSQGLKKSGTELGPGSWEMFHIFCHVPVLVGPCLVSVHWTSLAYECLFTFERFFLPVIGNGRCNAAVPGSSSGLRQLLRLLSKGLHALHRQYTSISIWVMNHLQLCASLYHKQMSVQCLS